MREVAAVLFDDFEMLDLYGPLEMLSFFRDEFRITTVAERTGAIRASGGPSTVADVTFDARDDFDILLVPGGRGTRDEVFNPALMAWLKSASEKAQTVASVCTGAMLLGRAGLLAGRKATTNKLAFQWVVDHAPDADWQRNARWVKDGRFFTSSGVSAGMDMTLAMLDVILGPEAAENAALWAEYIRNPDPDNDPFAGEIR